MWRNYRISLITLLRVFSRPLCSYYNCQLRALLKLWSCFTEILSASIRVPTSPWAQISRHNTEQLFKIAHTHLKMTPSALYVSPHNRYAIPPEHGKRLERLATGKKTKKTNHSYSLCVWHPNGSGESWLNNYKITAAVAYRRRRSALNNQVMHIN